MQKKIAFSIIIPTYNRPNLLVRSIESVLNQTYQNFEVIVVNDGSSEGSFEYTEIKKQFFNNEKLLFIDKLNGGPSSARNEGIRNSNGEYVCFLDDDDYYLDNHLNELYKLIQSNNSALGLYRTFSYFEEIGKGLIPQNYTKLGNEHAVIYILHHLLLPVNVCINKVIFNHYLFNESLRYAEDYELWVRILIEYPIFENPIHTTVYDRTRESASSGSIPVFLNYINSFEIIFSNSNSNKIISNSFKINKFKKYYAWIIAIYIKNNDFDNYKRLKKNIIKHINFGFYVFHYLRFIRKKIIK